MHNDKIITREIRYRVTLLAFSLLSSNIVTGQLNLSCCSIMPATNGAQGKKFKRVWPLPEDDETDNISTLLCSAWKPIRALEAERNAYASEIREPGHAYLISACRLPSNCSVQRLPALGNTSDCRLDDRIITIMFLEMIIHGFLPIHTIYSPAVVFRCNILLPGENMTGLIRARECLCCDL